MPEQSLPGLVLGGFGNRVRVVLIVDKKCVITNFDCPDALTTAAVAVNIFECSKVHLLLFQDAVVAQIISRLLLVELVLENMDLVVECLKFIEKRT